MRTHFRARLTLVAVGKINLTSRYNAGQRDWENRVQELVGKAGRSQDIRWHMIGHIQTTKSKISCPSCISCMAWIDAKF